QTRLFRSTDTANREHFTLSLHDALPISLAVSNWAQVNWAKAPVLIHPLTGEQLDLRESGGLMDTAIEAVKDRSLNHFSELALRRSEEHTSELQSRENIVCRLLLEKKNNK